MATAIYIPRINNNDDDVKVLSFDVSIGDKIKADQIVGQVETDKAVLDVTAPSDGFVLGFVAKAEEVVRVGSIMLWLGATKDEPIPELEDVSTGQSTSRGSQITAKALLLLQKNGLQSDVISPIDGRVTVEAVERYLSAHGGAKTEPKQAGAMQSIDLLPNVQGSPVNLTREEKGMAATVSWHRDFAVPGYIEIDYDLAPWAEYAKQFQDAKGLLMPPLLPLMAWRLVEVVQEIPRLNATMVGNKRFEYSPVNLGFTIQAGDALYLAVVRDAQGQDEFGFVNVLGDVLRRAAGHNLRESEASGATIGFSSMERWKVTRHIPILPPHTALMVAHAAGKDGKGVLGASYDHRVLNGGQVVAVLKKLALPKKN
ncbi:MAG: 2-oxo acid dehydrogenase subunit E2 [Betaproteobacteria bacterium]|nr:2-oxo acid dehydrogenase subunit E2 [Betaproteobacteria bacterium]